MGSRGRTGSVSGRSVRIMRGVSRGFWKCLGCCVNLEGEVQGIEVYFKQEISFPISCYKIPNSHKPLFYAACESFVMYADFTYLFISIHKILF